VTQLLAFLLALLTALGQVRVGTASFVGSSYGPRYLALPSGRGITVRICGRAACVVRTSTDIGPVRHLHRVADLSRHDFALVCGCTPERVGLTRVTVERLR
jgi:hypothetical protein